MTVSCVDIERFVEGAEMRMPFGFGSATVTHQPQLFLALDIEIDGEVTRGLAADGLSPQWFRKGASFEDGLDDMLTVIDAACEAALDIPPAETVYDAWWRIYERQREWASGTDHPPLLWAYGATLIERGLIDADCRRRGESFATVLRNDGFGLRLGDIHPELAGTTADAYLPEDPRRSITVRHTVAHDDPLTDAEIDPDQRATDGLPMSLAEYVEADGVDHFKLKLFGDVERDLERLVRIAGVLDERLGEEYVATMDANEQFDDAGAFREFWKAFRSQEALDTLRENTRYVEQPLPRHEAFTDDTAAVLGDWNDRPTIIIDESDAELDSFRRALETGYDGTSHKNVKGIFKSVANRCYVEWLRRTEPEEAFVMSAEDASNIGPVALLQDLAVVATLGFGHVERNGHRCFEGLSMFPEVLQAATLSAHGDLFARTENGTPAVNIREGSLRLGSVVEAPFGYDCRIDTDQLAPYSRWLASR